MKNLASDENILVTLMNLNYRFFFLLGAKRAWPLGSRSAPEGIHILDTGTGAEVLVFRPAGKPRK